MHIRYIVDSIGQKLNGALRWLLVDVLKSKAFVDFFLHEYSSYEHYREVQIFHNVRKLSRVWADAETLGVMARQLTQMLPAPVLEGLCHGTRNGFEQNWLTDNFPNMKVIGTDISPTATDYPNSVQWDFHDVNPDWVERFDFIYSNSHDQSWQPRQALDTWLGQLKPDGILVLEHSEDQSPLAAGQMDPFGVRPVAVPYVLSQWFGHRISVSMVEGRKANIGKKNWLFFIRKRADTVAGKPAEEGQTVKEPAFA